MTGNSVVSTVYFVGLLKPALFGDLANSTSDAIYVHHAGAQGLIPKYPRTSTADDFPWFHARQITGLAVICIDIRNC
jgi:hypothetical protein